MNNTVIGTLVITIIALLSIHATINITKPTHKTVTLKVYANNAIIENERDSFPGSTTPVNNRRK